MEKISALQQGKDNKHSWFTWLKWLYLGERSFLSISFRCLPPRPKQGWWQKNISSWSSFRAEQEPLKKKNKTVWWQLFKTILWELHSLSIYNLYLNQEAWYCPNLGIFCQRLFLKVAHVRNRDCTLASNNITKRVKMM